MYLIELFLPLANNEGNLFDQSEYADVQQTLADQFGGVTAYPRSPAKGLWKGPNDQKQRDELIVYEVMADELDERWWTAYRQSLEKRFRQERILIRSQEVRRL